MGEQYQIIFIFALFIGLLGVGLASWGSTDSYTLTAIPLFVLLAEVLQGSGLGLRDVRRRQRLQHRRGRLHRQGGVAAAEGARLRHAHGHRLAAAGSTLGILVPQSIAMIVYATFTETSVAKLFMAGVVPGIVLTVLFMVYVAVASKLRPGIAPREQGEWSRQIVLRALIDVVPFLLLILGILGTIYSSIATPTEAAAAGCLFALLLARVFGDLPWREFVACLKRSTLVVSNILLITYAAFIFSYAMSFAVIGLKLNRTKFFIALLILFTALGALVESLGMIVITVPLLYPLLGSYGIDPVWFGIIVVVFIEMGQITPPIGINLFVIQSISRGKLSDVVVGTVPFHLLMFVLLLVIFPGIALWLPGRIAGR